MIPVFPEILVWLNSDELPLSLLHNLVQILSYFQTPAAFADNSVDSFVQALVSRSERPDDVGRFPIMIEMYPHVELILRSSRVAISTRFDPLLAVYWQNAVFNTDPDMMMIY